MDIREAALAERIFGLYGFEFTLPFEANGIELQPLLGSRESSRLAADKEAFHLTGYGRIVKPSADPRLDAQQVHLIVSAMTFAQQQHVAATTLIDMSPGDTVESLLAPGRLPRVLPLMTSRHSNGEAILPDTSLPASRRDFIRAFASRFQVEMPRDALRMAFFRQIEVWRLATPYVELEHFLVFSGLELLARAELSYRGPNAAIPITKLLNDRGFGISQREVERWRAARNAAFHNGSLRCTDPQDGSEIEVGYQLYPMCQILADALLKMLPFDDAHINWNRWHDRMGFQ